MKNAFSHTIKCAHQLVNQLREVFFSSQCRLCLHLCFGNKVLFQYKKHEVSLWCGLLLCFPKQVCGLGLSKFSGIHLARKMMELLLPDVQALLWTHNLQRLQEPSLVPPGGGKLSPSDQPQTQWRCWHSLFLPAGPCLQALMATDANY